MRKVKVVTHTGTCTCSSSLEGAMDLKFVPFWFSLDALSFDLISP